MITDEEKLLKLRRKFLKLLHSSLYLNHNYLLPRIKETDLRYEKIELYNIAGKHEEALREILRMSEEDPTRAENYCLQYKEPTRYDQCNNENARAGLALFNPSLGHNPRLHALLKIHVDNGKYKEATDLLKRYPARFDPVEILNVLPSSVLISDVSDFLINSIKQTMHQFHHALVTKNIENATHLTYRYEKKKIEETNFKIDRETVCAVTGERIWDQPFYRYPNGTIVLWRRDADYDKHVCPKTKTDFVKNPYKF